MSFKQKSFINSAFGFLLFCGFFAFIGSAKESTCNCKEIIETKKCDNPNCLKICAVLYPLSNLQSQMAELCLGEGNQSLSLKKQNISALDIASITSEIKQKFLKIEKIGKKNLEKNCPQCKLMPEMSAHFKVEPPKKNCPDRYLKTHHYKKDKTKNKDKGVCKKTEIFKYFENYVQNLVNGKKEDSRKLWADCPDPCSFEVSYSVKIDEENCRGDVDVKIDCTHRVEKSFFGIPIYDVEFKYEGNLKC